ncbi:MAG: SelB C-terminal domain-containing protein [Deltaproteobacteria bacterium]|nr:SelB C-terminal domain-containing protein [Deltaproteobacteria bacterium]
MLTFGIAGHVDHGKTSLVRALTGMETDRLAEEQRRGISIELGFAWLDLAVPDHGTQRVALVDMPGHEKFVRRMIAGAAALDAVLLVVAADEGAMPQGREHLAICQLLGVRTGAVVLSKVDLVDREWLTLAEGDVRGLVAGTFLQDAPIWPTTVRDPGRIGALRAELAAFCKAVLDRRPHAGGEGRPFSMAIDRAFTIAGRGTVVAGTAAAGSVAVDQSLAVLPGGKVFRVRGVQTQGEARPTFSAPGRVAINLAHATLHEATVGMVVAAPDTLAVGRRAVARLALLPHAPPLGKEARLTLHVGTDSAGVRVRQLSGEGQQPDGTAWVELWIDRPMALAAGGRFVVRGSHIHPRLGRTVGGGALLCGWTRRLPAGHAQTLAWLDQAAGDDPTVAVVALLHLAGDRGLTESELAQACALPPPVVARALRDAAGRGLLRRAGSAGRSIAAPAFAVLESRMVAAVEALHRDHPARPGLDAESAARSIGAWIDPAVAPAVAAALVKRGALDHDGQVWSRPGFVAKAAVTTETRQRVVQRIASAQLQPPLFSELAVELLLPVKDIQSAAASAAAAGELVRLAEDHYLAVPAARAAADRVIAAFGAAESFTTGELKDLLGLTRKHLIPFAQWLDADKVTVRDPAGNRKIRARALAAWQARQPVP